MKLIDIAYNIDKSDANKDWVDTQGLGGELNVDSPCVEQDRIKCYWVGNWYCTDTYVGYRMYFFDDEPVAFSVQSGRKSNENFHWFSEDVAIKVRKYLLSLIVEEEEELSIVVLEDINEDIGDSFKIDFSGQILNNSRVKLNNEKVEIIERIKNKPYGIDTELKVRLTNGEEKHIDIQDLNFGYHVIG